MISAFGTQQFAGDPEFVKACKDLIILGLESQGSRCDHCDERCEDCEKFVELEEELDELAEFNEEDVL